MGARLVTLVWLAASALSLAASPSAYPAATQTGITIFARPTVIGWAQAAQLFGTARGAGLESVVTVEVKECGSSAFRTYAEAHANAGGGWSMDVATGVTSTFRAVWRRSTSPGVTIRQEASVSLIPRRAGRGFVVAVTSRRSLWRKKVEIQRRQGGAWRTMRTVTLTDSVRSTGTVSASEATFRLSVPRGTQLRALLPASQARPCYVESISRTMRT